MNYQIIPYGNMWSNGGFFTPSLIVEKYLKLASENQIKTLLLILNSKGLTDSETISKKLGCSELDAKEFVEFWIAEGLVCEKGEKIEMPKIEQTKQKNEVAEEINETNESITKKVQKEQVEKKFEKTSAPKLSPKDVIEACKINEEIGDLINTIETNVKCGQLSHIDRELIVNMVNHYGLSPKIVLAIMQYCYTQKAKGKAVAGSFISKMAIEWAEEGINTLELADAKLKEIEATDIQWKRVAEMIGVRHKSPTQGQRTTIKKWFDNFNDEMISLACDIMKENTDKPSIPYLNKILENWKKKNIKTAQDVEKDNEEHLANKEKNKNKTSGAIDKIEGAPTYDAEEVERRALFADTIDI